MEVPARGCSLTPFTAEQTDWGRWSDSPACTLARSGFVTGIQAAVLSKGVVMLFILPTPGHGHELRKGDGSGSQSGEHSFRDLEKGCFSGFL